jgi:hypothetical protein
VALACEALSRRGETGLLERARSAELDSSVNFDQGKIGFEGSYPDRRIQTADLGRLRCEGAGLA